MFIFDRESTSRGEAEREAQNLKQASGSGTVTTEPDAGLELTSCEIMT